MPGMDGFEVVEALSGSSRTKDIPVIFLSAINVDKKYISRGYQSGGVDYVTKPVDPDLLILKVKTFLKLRQQHIELEEVRDLLASEIEIRKEAQENLEVKVSERTAELLAKNEELELRNHELQQFAWVVSHDLKEPLRKIEIFTSLIKDRFADADDQTQSYIDRTIHAANRMSKLISDLLEYSRLSQEFEPEAVDLNDIVGEVMADLDFQIEQKSAKLVLSDLPVINGVPSQMRQVFHNLIGNSLKFAQENQPPVIEVKAERVATKTVKSKISPDGKFWRITVRDNGIGFDETYIEKIFIIFQSLHARETYDGTGIGLAIAKKIIEKHNGMITARSKPGHGATFIILLPL
jgi:light-regulated signal transduction histidine kinase (bacteriophytochrome)